MNKLVDQEKIVHIDALSLYKKYTDVFYMEDVSEVERNETARQVADQILRALPATVAAGTNKDVAKEESFTANGA